MSSGYFGPVSIANGDGMGALACMTFWRHQSDFSGISSQMSGTRTARMHCRLMDGDANRDGLTELYRALTALGWMICTVACGGADGGPVNAVKEWRIGPEPLVAVGDVDAEEPYLFARIAGAGILSDGRIVAADGMSGTIRVFHPDGRLDRQMGGIGDGPGEFRYLNALRISDPDTIVAYDSQAMRRTAFLATGELISTVSFASPDGWPEVYLGAWKQPARQASPSVQFGSLAVSGKGRRR